MQALGCVSRPAAARHRAKQTHASLGRFRGLNSLRSCRQANTAGNRLPGCCTPVPCALTVFVVHWPRPDPLFPILTALKPNVRPLRCSRLMTWFAHTHTHTAIREHTSPHALHHTQSLSTHTGPPPPVCTPPPRGAQPPRLLDEQLGVAPEDCASSGVMQRAHKVTPAAVPRCKLPNCDECGGPVVWSRCRPWGSKQDRDSKTAPACAMQADKAISTPGVRNPSHALQDPLTWLGAVCPREPIAPAIKPSEPSPS